MAAQSEFPGRERSGFSAMASPSRSRALSLLVRWPLWPVLGNQTPHMTFFPAVMISAYYGGFGPGLLAAVLSALVAHYFLGDTRAFKSGSVDQVRGAHVVPAGGSRHQRPH